MGSNHFKVSKGLTIVGVAADPSDPINGDIIYNTTLNQFRKYENGSWSALGSGSGGSGGLGLNLIGLDTNWAATNTNDPGAELAVGNWVAYADAAGATPVDMTGGSPVVTIARTTTVGEVLDGTGSFKVVKDAANRQGNGVSVLVNVPLGYRGQKVSFAGIFKIISGSIAAGDIVMSVYDVTNATLLTVTNPNLATASGYFLSHFTLGAATAQLRVGFHFATTVTTAVTLSFDDAFMLPKRMSFDAGSPLVTDGDLLVRLSGVNDRLAVGAKRRILQVSPTTSLPEYLPALTERNYIDANPDGEVDTTGYAAYADAAAALPVDATGGSPNVTITRTTSSPLRGDGSLLITKDAANRQGQGVSYAFSVDRADLAKILTVTADYEIASGTYADGDLAVYLIEDTSGTPVVIQPAGYVIQKLSTGIMGKIQAVFQTTSDSAKANYRVAFHVASTSASAYTVKLDNLRVGPQILQYGPPVTDEVSVTMTPNGVGTTTLGSYYVGRVGSWAKFRGYFKTGTLAAATFSVSLPAGYVIDSSKITTATNAQRVGEGFRIRTGVAGGPDIYYGFYDGSTTDRVFFAGQSAADQITKINGSGAFATGDGFTFEFMVPIAGWSSTVQMSNDTDTRIVDLNAYKNAGSVTANTDIPTWTAVNKDSHGAFNATTGVYTVPVPGDYAVAFHAITTAGNPSPKVVKNGTLWATGLGSSTNTAIYTLLPNCKAGDTITVQLDTNSTLASSNTQNMLSISRLSGPSAIAATESVGASYTSNLTTTLSSSGTIIQYNTKVYDTHNAVTTGSSWVFTAPVSGKYRVNASIATDAITGEDSASCYVYVNGVQKARGIYSKGSTSATQRLGVMVNYTAQLLAGDTLQIRGDSSSSARTLDANPPDLFVIIERTGNY